MASGSDPGTGQNSRALQSRNGGRWQWVSWRNQQWLDMATFKAMLFMLVLAPALAPAADAPPPEDEINVVGLSSGKAVVQFNSSPKPRVLRDGDTLPGGIKLIKAT